MAQNPSFMKRQKEIARIDKQKEKNEKRKQRKAEKEERVRTGTTEEFVTRESLEE